MSSLFEVTSTEHKVSHTLTEGFSNADDGYDFMEEVDAALEGWRLHHEFGDWPFIMVWTKGYEILEYREHDIRHRIFRNLGDYEKALGELPIAP